MAASRIWRTVVADVASVTADVPVLAAKAAVADRRLHAISVTAVTALALMLMSCGSHPWGSGKWAL